MTVSERKRIQQEQQRFHRTPQQHEDEKITSSNNKNHMVWIPPKAKDRHGLEADEDDLTEVRDQRGQAQQKKHHAVLTSMDLIVDGNGFLVPRKSKKAVDESTVDWNGEEEYEDEESSSSDQSSSQEEGANNANNYNNSFSSIPYCHLMPDGLDTVGVAPQTPSGHRSSGMGKSFSTLETEAMTRTTAADSQSEMFLSPRPSPAQHYKGASFRSPRAAQHIPQNIQKNGADLVSPLVSPLAGPSPGGSGARRGGRSSRTRIQASGLSEEYDQDGFYTVPEVTSPCGSAASKSSRGDLHSRTSSSSTSKSRENRKKDAMVGSPVISTSRISMVAKQMGSLPLSSSYKSPPTAQRQSRQSLQRHRSESAADPPHKTLVNQQSSSANITRGVHRGHSESATKDYPKPNTSYTGMEKRAERQRKTGKDRHFVPGNVEDVMMLNSPTTAGRTSSNKNNRTFQSPIKTPSSSSRDTTATTGLSLSNSTGRGTLSSAVDLGSHFQQQQEELFLSPSPKSPSRRSQRRTGTTTNKDGMGLLDQIGALDLLEEDDTLDDDVSSAGAVIIQTKKILVVKTNKNTPTTSNRKGGKAHHHQ